MKKLLLVTGLVWALAIPAIAASAEKDPITGNDPDKSETKCVVTIDGKDVAVDSVRSAYMVAFVKREGAKADDLNDQVIPIQCRDFKTGTMFSFYEGFYIIESDVIKPDGSSEPHVIGFASRDEAYEYWEGKGKRSGRVVNFETATREYAKTEKVGGEPSKGEAAAEKQIEHLMKWKPQK